MTTLEATIAMSHLEGVSDTARARELYKYYQPTAPTNSENAYTPLSKSLIHIDESHAARDLNITSHISSSKISSPDTALTVFCQLTAWRIGCQRALISLIDAETQYFVAESTRTVDLVDSTNHEPGDELWMGCSSVSKAGRLCERTIAVAPTDSQSYPCLSVDDLSLDERFESLPFVTGAPYLRRYVGVPLITKRGIPIGSLFVVDSRPGNGLSKGNNEFMGAMAKTIMRHLELVREVEEHRRAMKMSRGLASFVEGRDELIEAEMEENDGEGTKMVGKLETESMIANNISEDSVLNSGRGSFNLDFESENVPGKKEELCISTKKATDSSVSRKLKPVGNQYNSSQTTTAIAQNMGAVSLLIPDKISSAPEENSEEASIRTLFSRAAYLIREAFEVNGGTVFYDARTGQGETLSSHKTSMSPCRSKGQSHFDCESYVSDNRSELTREEKLEDSLSSSPVLTISPFSNGNSLGLENHPYTSSNTTAHKQVDILGYSTINASSIKGNSIHQPKDFKPFGDKALYSILRRYPRGKLWTFSSDGSLTSEENITKRASKDPNQLEIDVRVTSRSDARFLSRHFPCVRQLLFVPLWDAGRTRWLSGCFTWSTEPTRILSKQKELSFLTAFGNSVMAEWARITTEIADQKKSDFIGSISHELRSPLHGILASAEFLEEATTGWERQLVETIESCGRTLLDTINNVLDFSKINHFESNWRNSKRARSRSCRSVTLNQSDLPMLKLFQDIDISVICEEVVDSVFAGHVFQNITAQSFDQVSDAQVKMSEARHPVPCSEQIIYSKKFNENVVVILDINPQNYHITSQPGALRRLIMNLLGNSLKYTSHGFVKVTLDCTDMEDLVRTGPLGKKELLPRSMLNLTVTDTGKGISPDFLRNKLFVPFTQENTLSSGTGLGLSIVRAIVSLLEGDINIKSEIGHGTEVKVSIPVLHKMPSTSISSTELLEPVTTEPRVTQEAISKLRARVAGHRVGLYGFDTTRENVDFIIAHMASHATITKLAHQAVKLHGNHPSIIVLCSHCSVIDRMFTIAETQCKVGFTAKPIGPVKLAKAISQTLTDAIAAQSPGLEISSLGITDVKNIPDKNLVNGKSGEMSEDNRIAAENSNSNSWVTRNSEPICLDQFKLKTQQTSSHGYLDSIPDKTATVKRALNPLIYDSSTKPVAPPSQNIKIPKVLIVDDNHINMRLLVTYLRRRAYPCIDTASNGLEAVQKCENFSQGYDIIFMDITMPIMDGFSASKKIREIESSRHLRAEKSAINSISDGSLQKQNLRSAFIIAFTGRSSIEDQNEALRCGIDLFMTKPVAFKEVGKVCDNWIAHQVDPV